MLGFNKYVIPFQREKDNLYVFEVDKKANKSLIKEAFEAIFKVKPLKVNIVNKRSKAKQHKNGTGYTSSRKKAYIFIDRKDKLDLFEGV